MASAATVRICSGALVTIMSAGARARATVAPRRDHAVTTCVAPVEQREHIFSDGVTPVVYAWD